MGLWDKIGHALEGSGVAVAVQSPGQLTPGAPALHVEVMLEAKTEPKTVTNVELALMYEQTYQQEEYVNGQEQDESHTNRQQIMVLQNPAPITLQPGTPVTVPFDMQVDAMSLQQMSQGSMGGFGGGLGGGMGMVMNIFDPQFASQNSFYLEAKATVEGSHLHPKGIQQIYVQGTSF